MLWAACKKEKTTSTYEDPAFKPSGSMADLVYNPVRPDGTIDSSFLPILTLKDTIFDFGTVNEGDIVTKQFFLYQHRHRSSPDH
jgi:hypothetical protein